MTMKPLAALLLGSTLLGSAAMAEEQPLGATDARPGNTQFITNAGSGVIPASKLIGQDIYGANNEEIGEVDDIVIDQNGGIAAFVIDLDDVPGMDDRTVAVPVQAIQINPEQDDAETTGSVQGATGPSNAPQGQQSGSVKAMGRVLDPDRVVLTMPMDQLQALPAFEDEDD